MDIIAESVNASDSFRFIRFYKRDQQGADQAISLDIAKHIICPIPLPSMANS
ncbi:DUF3164 family protein [Pseudoalteromonas sp. B95]|nr:DUF3164 family protein [Pseudoalteromonas sp. B95]MDK1286410.1 DUF3164 family protein [Pseudoalteromonas sp. B95]